MLLALPFQAAFAGPQGGQVVAGQGSISRAGATTTINQQSQNLAVDWQSFNVGSNELVRFKQPSSNAAALNRIFDQNPSQIYGSIEANGTVLLLNPNGVIFQPGSHVSVGSLVAAGMQMSVGDFMSGNYKLENLSDSAGGRVVNRGLIEAATGGSVTLAGKSVSNEGLILANAGRVNLAAGRRITLDFDGDGLIRFTVDEGVLKNAAGTNAAVSNTGKIVADGGQVLLTGKAAENVFSQVVNNQGLIRAARVENQGGVVKLVGLGPSSSVVNTGTINVAGQGTGSSGGTVTLTAANVTQSGTIDASAAAGGDGGRIELKSADTTTLGGDSITIARSDSGGKGGTVEAEGDHVGLFDNSMIDVSGTLGGGTVLIGGGRHGEDTAVQNASRTYVGPNATIIANAAESGDGGSVIVWSDEVTRFFGSISARGGAQAGSGGFAEISSAGNLHFDGAVDLYAPGGSGGNLLFDPNNITFSNNPDNNNFDFNPPGDQTEAFADDPGTNSNFDVTGLGILSLVSSGTTITFQALNNITVTDPFNIQTATTVPNVSVVMQAGNNININAPLTADGTGSISLTANDPGGTRSGSGSINIAGTGSITSAAGNVSLTVDGGTGSIVVGGAITTGAGNVTLATNSGSGTLQLGAGITTNGGNIDASAVAGGTTLTAGETLDTAQSGAAGSVSLGAVNGAQALTIDASGAGGANGGNVVLGAIGGTTPLSKLTVSTNGASNGQLTLNGNVSTDAGNIDFSSAPVVELGTNIVLDTESGNNQAAGSVLFASAGNLNSVSNHSLSIDTSTTAPGLNGGNVNLSRIGAANPIGGLSISTLAGAGGVGGTVTLNGSIVSKAAAVDLSNVVSTDVAAASKITSTGQNISFGGTITDSANDAVLTLDAGAGNISLLNATFDNAGGSGTSGLAFSSGAKVTLNGAITQVGSLDFSNVADGDTIALGNTASIKLTGTSSAITTTGENINGPFGLTLTTVNGGIALQNVGNSTPLASLKAVSTAGTLTLDGNISVDGGGAVDLQNIAAVTLGNNVTIDTDGAADANAGSILFGNATTVNGAKALVLDASANGTNRNGGAVNLGVLGGATPLNSLSVTTAPSGSGAPGTISLNGNLSTGDVAGNNVTLTGPVALAANVSINTDNATNDGNISFTSTLNADSAANSRTLTATAGTGTVTFGGNVGGTQALADLDVTGSTINLNAGTYDVNAGAGGNTVTLNGGVVVGTSASLDTTGNNLTFTGSLDGTSAFAQDLTVTAGTGNVSFLGTAGTSQALGNVQINSGGSLSVNSNSVTAGKDEASTTDTFLANSLKATLSGTVDIGGAGVGKGGDLKLQGSGVTNALDIKSTNAITIDSNIVAQSGNIVLEATANGQDITIDTAGLPAVGDYSKNGGVVARRVVQAVNGNVTTLVGKGGAITNLVDARSGGSSTSPIDGMNTVLSASGTVSADGLKTGTNLQDSVFPQITSSIIDLVYTGNLMLGDQAAGARGTGTSLTDAQMDGLLSPGTTTLTITTTGGDIVLDRASPFTAASGAESLTLSTDQQITDNSAGLAFQSTGTLTLTSAGAIGIDNTSGSNTDGTMTVDVGTLVVNSSGGHDINITDTGGGGNTAYSVTTGGGGNVTLTQQTNDANISALSTTGNATVTASAGNVNVNTALDGLGSASFTATGNTVTFNNAVGGITPLASLTASGSAVSLQAVATTGAQSYTGATTLNGNLLSTTGGAITVSGAATLAAGPIRVQTAGAAATDDIAFTSTIDGAQALTLNAGAGDISIGGTGQGTALTSLTAAGNTITVQGVRTTGSQTYTGALTVNAGATLRVDSDNNSAETLTIAGTLAGGGQLAGGTDNNDTLSSPAAANTWSINAANSGTLNGVSFADFANLAGGVANDTFNFSGTGSLSGTLDGGAGAANSISWSGVGTSRGVTLTSPGASTGFDGTEASIGGGFKNITSITGSSAADSLTGLNAASTWMLAGPGSESYQSTNKLSFSSFENLNGGGNTDTFNISGSHTGNVAGGGGSDAFVFTGTGKVSGGIDGGAGADTLDYSGFGSALIVSIAGPGSIDGFQGAQPSTVTGGYDNIDGVKASAGSTFVAPNTNNAWDITAADVFTLNGSTLPFTGFANLTGGTASDTFTLKGGVMSGSIAGGGGSDTLVGDNTVNTWTITGADAGKVSGANGTQAFSGIGSLTGNAQADSFTFNAGGSLSGVLNGAGGSDSASYAAVAAPVTLTLARTC